MLYVPTEFLSSFCWSKLWLVGAASRAGSGANLCFQKSVCSPELLCNLVVEMCFRIVITKVNSSKKLNILRYINLRDILSATKMSVTTAFSD